MTRAARESDRSIEPRIQVSSFECMCLLVESGLGIALLPERIVAPRVEAGNLSMVRLKDSWAQRQIQIVVRDLDNTTFTTRALIDHLRESDSPI